VQPRKKISLDQRAACQHDVVIPTLDLANGTGENYKFVALFVPIVPSTLQPTLSAVSRCFERVSSPTVGAIFAACSCNSFAVARVLDANAGFLERDRAMLSVASVVDAKESLAK